MIESPLLQGLKDGWTSESRAEDVVRVLEARFERVPADLREAVRGIRDEARLAALLTSAARCLSLDEFRTSLSG